MVTNGRISTLPSLSPPQVLYLPVKERGDDAPPGNAHRRRLDGIGHHQIRVVEHLGAHTGRVDEYFDAVPAELLRESDP